MSLIRNIALGNYHLAHEEFDQIMNEGTVPEYSHYVDRMGHVTIRHPKSGKSVYLQGDDARQFHSEKEAWEKKHPTKNFDHFVTHHGYDGALHESLEEAYLSPVEKRNVELEKAKEHYGRVSTRRAEYSPDWSEYDDGPSYADMSPIEKAKVKDFNRVTSDTKRMAKVKGTAQAARDSITRIMKKGQPSLKKESIEQINEVMEHLHDIVQNKQAKRVKFENGKSALVDVMTASAVTSLHKQVKPEVQTKLQDMVKKSPAHLAKAAGIAFGLKSESVDEPINELFGPSKKKQVIAADEYKKLRVKKRFINRKTSNEKELVHGDGYRSHLKTQVNRAEEHHPTRYGRHIANAETDMEDAQLYGDKEAEEKAQGRANAIIRAKEKVNADPRKMAKTRGAIEAAQRAQSAFERRKASDAIDYEAASKHQEHLRRKYGKGKHFKAAIGEAVEVQKTLQKLGHEITLREALDIVNEGKLDRMALAHRAHTEKSQRASTPEEAAYHQRKASNLSWDATKSGKSQSEITAAQDRAIKTAKVKKVTRAMGHDDKADDATDRGDIAAAIQHIAARKKAVAALKADRITGESTLASRAAMMKEAYKTKAQRENELINSAPEGGYGSHLKALKVQNKAGTHGYRIYRHPDGYHTAVPYHVENGKEVLHHGGSYEDDKESVLDHARNTVETLSNSHSK